MSYGPQGVLRDARADVVILENGEVQVVVLPGKGCDIYELRDLHSGIDVLAKTRLGLADLQGQRYWRSSTEAWLSQYLGGWQLVLPNGGDAAIVDGVEWGFHGEACQLRWTVEELSSVTVQASVRLTSSPLRVQRNFDLIGRTLRLRERVQNEHDRPVSVMWSQHPAFGAPFLDGSCLISMDASTVTADDVAPGTFLAPGSVHQWPAVVYAGGEVRRLDKMPGAGSGVACLAYVSGLQGGFFAITNPVMKLGVAFSWPLSIFPNAWYWIEAGASQGFPWFGSHYTLAVEPATSAPAQGMNMLKEKGGLPLVLDPGAIIEATFEVTLFTDTRRVVGVSEGGTVEFEGGAHE